MVDRDVVEYIYWLEFDNGALCQCNTAAIERQKVKFQVPSFYALIFLHKRNFPHSSIGSKTLGAGYTYSKVRSWWVETEDGKTVQHSNDIL